MTLSIPKPIQNGAKFLSDMAAPVDTNGAHPTPSVLEKDINDLQYIAEHGDPFSLSDIPAFIDAAKNLNGVGLDDRKFLLEKLLTIMSRLPKDSAFSQKLQQFVIGMLYKDLPHPPSGYLSLPESTQTTPTAVQASSSQPQQPVTYAFRSADGSNYNPLLPNLGKAKSPYARSVPSQKCLSPAGLPDPELVFDTLLKRDKFVEHPGGISSLFFAFADLVIHSIFNTNARNWGQNDASSYLDLSPLYGSSKEEVDKIRRKDGTGRLWNDVFADSRLLLMPPSVCALLVLLSRNHNYVAEKILNINERGTYSVPPPADEAKRLAQDEEIFQRARLVNSGYFMQIILSDYVGAILGLVRDGLSWRLNPLMNTRDPDHEVSPRGEGNVVSIEFNLLYRWHATVSQEDTAWTEKIFTELFQGKDYRTITVDQFAQAVRQAVKPNPDIKQWTFDGLQRDETGRFADADIARILQSATESSSSAFKARGTPEVLRVIELLSIEQARTWGTCSLNEFRSFLALKPYASFKEWNPDPEIYTAAEALYHDIDNLELHVGLQAEEAKVPMPGAGLCPGYTISRAILADAVCLTRGDRFLTVDFTPFNLTNWGYQDCQFDDSDGSFGGMLTKLLYRHLPDYYPARSTYAHFPFIVPKTMKEYAAKFPDDLVSSYTWTKPLPPPGPLVVAKTYADVKQVVDNAAVFTNNADARISVLTKGITINTAPVERLLFAEAQIDRAVKSMSDITSKLISTKAIQSIGSGTKYVDIVRDVLNLLPVHWFSNDIVGLSIKSEQNPRGIFREYQLISMFNDISDYVYFNQVPAHDWSLRTHGREATDKILQCVRSHMSGRRTLLGRISDDFHHMAWDVNDNSDAFLSALDATRDSNSDSALDSLAASLFAEVIPTAALFSKALVHVVNYYLDPSRQSEKEQLQRLTAEGSNAQVLAMVYEALRLDPPISSVRRTAISATTLAGSQVQKGQVVLASLIDANQDPSVFPNPKTANYSRPASTVGVFGFDQKGLLATKLFEQVAPRVLHVIFSLKNLSRANMKSGQLNRFTQLVDGIPQETYININGELTPFPTSLVVQFTA